MKTGKNLFVPVLILFSLVLVRPVWGESVKPVLEIDHPVVLAQKRGPVYLLVRFEVAEAGKDPSKPRPKLNLAMVIDRSGSMEDKGKMEYAKEAAKILVDGLESSDRLSIVEYDDRITVLWPSSPVESPGMIKKRIDTLSPRGSTNLAGGMMKWA